MSLIIIILVFLPLGYIVRRFYGAYLLINNSPVGRGQNRPESVVPACRKRRLKGTCSRAAATTVLGVGADNRVTYNGRNCYTPQTAASIYGN